MLRTATALLASAAVLAAGAAPRAAAAESVVRLVMSADPPQLDSTKATDQASFWVLGHVMEGLTRYGKAGEIIPGVAERWTIDDRGAVFHLRKDARWADGKPVTARDFVFAWRTVVDPATGSEYAFIMYPLKNAEAVNQGKLPPTALGVQAKDDHTLAVEFEKPCGYFLGLTAFGVYLPVRQDFYEARRGRYAAGPADLLANGPYVLAEWVHDARIVLEKNPRWWGAESIRIDRVEVPYFTADSNARLNLFIDGKVDLLGGLGRNELNRAQVERFKMKSFSDGTLLYLEFNFREGRPTRNLNLRKAIRLAFDPAEYVSKVIGVPGNKPGLGIIPQWLQGVERPFRQEYPLTPPKPDLEAARRHLELARRELGGTIPPLAYLTGDTPDTQREAEYFQRLLKTKLGIDLRIDKQVFKQRLAKMTSGEFDLVAAGWGPDFADPMTFAELWTSWNENNRGRWRNERYDALVRKAQSTSDPKIRMDAMAAAERIALEEVAIIPTFERAVIWVHAPRVSGIVRHVLGPDPDFTFATIVDERTASAPEPR
jgi:oligopeptide transport system substrate-binding protein